MEVGFVGLGIMGRPMALNLLKAGHRLHVWSRRAESMQPLLDAGAIACDSAAQVARDAEVTFCMVADAPDVEQVALGERGIAAGAVPGHVFIDMSTIAPSAARSIAGRLAERGIHMLDAPVSGGEVGAIGGSLTIMVGGRGETFERMRPLFECLGKSITLIGDSGAGQVAKACNQVVTGVSVTVIAEAFNFARQNGVDVERVREALLGGFAASRILDNHGGRMLARNFRPGFKAWMHQKDLRIVLDEAHRLGIALPAAAATAQMFNAMSGSGLGEDDSVGVLKLYERLSGGEGGMSAPPGNGCAVSVPRGERKPCGGPAVLRLGFIGLGAMGRPMAGHLLRGGHQLSVYARRAEALAPLVDGGARACESPAEVARHADVVFTMVTSNADVEQVTLGENGIAQGAAPGSVVVDMSTIAPSVARRIAYGLAARGIEMLDAPVSGGTAGAEAATLAIMAGGKLEVLQQVRPLLDLLGKTVVHVGDHGAGQVAKACNQMVMVSVIEAAAEAMHLANAAGVDAARVREALLGGSAQSRVLDLFGGRMVARDFRPGVEAWLHHKDFGLVLREAADLGAPLPISSQVWQQLNALMGLDMAHDDTSSLLRVLEAQSGRAPA